MGDTAAPPLPVLGDYMQSCASCSMRPCTDGAVPSEGAGGLYCRIGGFPWTECDCENPAASGADNVKILNVNAAQVRLDRWMGDIADMMPSGALAAKSLREMRIPGTHDSATGGVSPETVVLNIGEPWKTLLRVLNMQNLAPTIIASWAKAQVLYVFQQLYGGARYFDLRPCYKMFGGQMFQNNHGPALGESMPAVLGDVAKFLAGDGRDREVVFLHFKNAFSDFDSQQAYDGLWDLVKRTVGDRLYPNSAHGGIHATSVPTMGQLWAAGKQVILQWDDSTLPSDPAAKELLWKGVMTINLCDCDDAEQVQSEMFGPAWESNRASALLSNTWTVVTPPGDDGVTPEVVWWWTKNLHNSLQWLDDTMPPLDTELLPRIGRSARFSAPSTLNYLTWDFFGTGSGGASAVRKLVMMNTGDCDATGIPHTGCIGLGLDANVACAQMLPHVPYAGVTGTTVAADGTTRWTCGPTGFAGSGCEPVGAGPNDMCCSAGFARSGTGCAPWSGLPAPGALSMDATCDDPSKPGSHYAACIPGYRQAPDCMSCVPSVTEPLTDGAWDGYCKSLGYTGADWNIRFTDCATSASSAGCDPVLDDVCECDSHDNCKCWGTGDTGRGGCALPWNDHYACRRKAQYATCAT